MRNNIKYIDFAETFRARPLFSIKDIRKAYPDFQKRRLYEWQKKGYLVNISKGYYIFSSLKPDERLLFYIANKIRPCSYVSLETALAYYQLIPENVFSVTSVSTKKTIVLKSKLAGFIYKKISPDIFFGYDLIRDGDRSFRLAKPEKAFIDYFYLNPDLKSESAFEALRVNAENFRGKVKKSVLSGMLGKTGNKGLSRRISDFLEFIKNA